MGGVGSLSAIGLRRAKIRAGGDSTGGRRRQPARAADSSAVKGQKGRLDERVLGAQSRRVQVGDGGLWLRRVGGRWDCSGCLTRYLQDADGGISACWSRRNGDW